MVKSTEPIRPILALDASWTCTGWAMVTQDGPDRAGSFSPSGTWKWERLEAHLSALIEEAGDWVETLKREHGADRVALPRLVVEEPTDHRKRTERRNDRITLRGLSYCVGGVALQGVRHGWASPWPVDANDWRAAMGWRSGTREALKAAARRTVASRWPMLREHVDRDTGADVCEAILLGWCASREGVLRPPKGPTRDVVVNLGDW